MAERADTLSTVERIATVLSCLAVDRRLGGVLFVGLPPPLLAPLGRWLAAILGKPEEVVSLGATETDDDLWWRAGASSGDGRFQFWSVPGPLVDPPDAPPRVIVVPDLARASLAVVRAAVVLVGTDTAVADRHGGQLRWQPRSRWLAACARSELGRLSAHLFDLFVVWVDAAGLSRPPLEPQVLRDALDGGDLDLLDLPEPPVRGEELSNLPVPRLTDRAAQLVMDLVGAAPAVIRRDLALARTARALAALDRTKTVLADHVQRAAQLLGFTRADGYDRPGLPPPVPTLDFTLVAVGAGRDGVDAPDPAPGPEPTGTDTTHSAGAALDETALPTHLLSASLYPEDSPDALAEYAALRAPWQRRSRHRARRGAVIGTEPTRSLTDVALVATALEAAKFQPIRRAAAGVAPQHLLIRPSDLRGNRRQSQPGTAMVLVFDHTCRQGWDWSTALAPYLQWAYTQRAALTLIELGHRDNADELRAERYRASGVLDRRVAAALDRACGRATPLAYALDLAVQELRRRLRYGRAGAEHAWLVVASDGRGNVPLQASLRRELTGPVGPVGVSDALAVAASVRSLPAVQAVVLAPPGLTHYAHLPFELAEAMGGIVAELEESP